ncbi:MAG: hypothetical protein ACXAEX_06225 [Promethearchaeota archaeon]
MHSKKLKYLAIPLTKKEGDAKQMQQNLIAHWNFDEIIDDSCVLDVISHNKDKIIGYIDLLDGVEGKSLRFDGYTTHIMFPKNCPNFLEG